MFKRPALLLFTSFAAGILVGHYWISKPVSLALFLFLLIPFALFLLIPGGKRIIPLLGMFFASGIFLDSLEHKESQLLPMSNDEKVVRAYGRVIEVTKKDSDSLVFLFEVYELWNENSSQSIDEATEVVVKTNPPLIFSGEYLLLYGILTPIRGFLTEGATGNILQKNLKGVYTRFKISDGRYIVPVRGRKGPLYGKLLPLKASYLEFLRANLREDLFPIASAILLGEKALIPQDTKDCYAKVGLNHILVVSGLHLGLLAGGVFLILRLTGLRLSPGGYLSGFVPLFLCGLITVFYVAITGFHVSGQRAMLMIFVFLLSFAVLKRIDSFNSLAIAGLAMLFVDPHNIFSLSFQLSFLAVLGVIWANGHIIKQFAERIHGKLTLNYYIRKLLIYSGSLIIVSISVNLFLLPILVYNFNQFSTIGAFVNLICVPLLGVLVVPFGLVSIIISTFSESLGSYILIPSSLGLILIDGAVRFASKLSFASFFWVTPYLWEMALFYLLLSLGFFSFRGKSLFGFSLGLLLLSISFHVLWVSWDSYGPSGMDISFLDVGQGNSTFIRAGKGSILIDAGGLPGTDYDVGKGVVSKFLWHKRVRSLDLAILTHPDYDHMQGFQFLLEAFYVKRFLTLEYPLPLELVSRLKEKKITILEVSEKITISDRYYHIEIFHPTAETISFCSDLNDLALILKVSSQYGSVLITGDNGRSVLDRVAEIYGSKLKADVLLIPHHGSKSSLSKKFYEGVKPKLAVISCGYKNPYSLPNKEVLNALHELNIEILSTNTCGSITVSLMGYKDEGDVQMKTQCFLKQKRIS